jgi:aminopeptidase N
MSDTFYFSASTSKGTKRWPAKDFFDRWTFQSNFPLVRVEVTGQAPTQQVTFTQFRSLNTNFSIFAGDLLYPSPFGFVWYIPLTCEVGTGPLSSDPIRLVTYYVDQRTGIYIEF